MNTIPLRTLPEVLEPLAAELERVEEKLRERTLPASVYADYPQLPVILEHLVGSGGKRLRPALVLLAGRFYPSDPGKLVSLAASVEMLHTATLVHDDLVDGALLRRGTPTLNADWSPGATVLAGDYLFARSASLAAETENVRVVTIFANTLMTICSGELRQIFDRHELPRLDSEDAWNRTLALYDQRIHAKTASLFAAATEAAAVLSGAPEAHVAALRRYGSLLGAGFQIIDDILDFSGDQGMLGKPVGSDLREGIVTLPVLYYAREHQDDDRVAAVVRDGSDDALVRELVAAIRESGAVSRAAERARQLIRDSHEALAEMPESEPRFIMHTLAEYTLSRKR